MLTRAGAEFVTPLSVSALAGVAVQTELFDLTAEAEMGHIQLSRAADLLVVAPVTADLMAKMAQGGGDVPDAMKEMVRKEMDKLMQNPQLLADDKYVKDISRQMRMGNTMGRLSGFLQDTFGIDKSGAMGGMGGFFQGIANWFKDFLGAFSGGGVKDFLSQPSNKNLGMFDKLSAGIGFAMNKANNQYHSPYEGIIYEKNMLPKKK